MDMFMGHGGLFKTKTVGQKLLAGVLNTTVAVNEMQHLPVAGVLWKPLPDLQTSAEARIYAGGALHSVLSYSLAADNMRDFAEMMGIELIHIGATTNIEDFRKEVFYNDVAYKLHLN